MQYSQEHLKTMVYAKFGGQTECIMGNWKIENAINSAEPAVSVWENRRFITSIVRNNYYLDHIEQMITLLGQQTAQSNTLPATHMKN